MNSSQITIVIPTYNRAHLLTNALESVFNQSLQNWKLLIIDDASTDDTESMIQSYMNKDNRVHYYKMEQNKGVCHVLNKALDLVDTEYMVQLDSDDWLEKDALEELLKNMEREPKTTALAYGNHKACRERGNGILIKQRSFRTPDKYDLICYTHMFYPRFYRTSCLRDVGGWETCDKYGGRYMEDRRILFKLIEKYDFLWIDKHLYNLNRYNDKRLTIKENRPKYIELKQDLIKKMLKKWGDEFEPEFSTKTGWLRTKLIPKKKQST
nr:glycosyltransferase family 2 protein [Bacillus sp. FJAT-47783]